MNKSNHEASQIFDAIKFDHQTSWIHDAGHAVTYVESSMWSNLATWVSQIYYVTEFNYEASQILNMIEFGHKAS